MSILLSWCLLWFSLSLILGFVVLLVAHRSDHVLVTGAYWVCVAYEVAPGESTFCAVAPFSAGALCAVLFARSVVVVVVSPTVFVTPFELWSTGIVWVSVGNME